MALFGFRALMSLRMEKSFGTWFREYRPIYTPLEAGMDRYLKLDHDFVGRAALEAEMARGPERRLVYLDVDPDPDEPADVIGDEPIWHDGEVVGWVTSGAYAHHSRRSLALGYVPAALAVPGARRSRSRSSATAARPACSTSPCSTRPGSGCAPEWGGSPTSSDAGNCSTASSPTSPSTAWPTCRCGRWPRARASASTASSTTSARGRRWSSPRCAGRSRSRRTCRPAGCGASPSCR